MTLYEMLAQFVEGLPRAPGKRELHCHPDVYMQLRQAYQPPSADMLFPDISPIYGTMDVIVKDGYPKGYWRVYENGAMIKDGYFALL